ncbi:glycosyltransferase family 2 protein [Pontibacter sp. Tf4]|uniref:glycosyltransferase family 2 protein n=1 Tax=Pontibacter sp. Tf4 TaxID=2761620 RepID=UPI00162A78A9|nr:glycosyltransferase family 2 protein [Pontibacter sp. Tf4]MBB6610335.1 glycosyltransferase family 2 protein [Pontibacter sp. Tf4]
MIQVSIIIPHYNRTEILGRTLKSVLDQTHTNWEVIIVDDKSEFNEYQKLLSVTNDKRIRVIQNSTDLKGPSICRNIGASEANGKYLLFLDSDDLLAPFCLEQRIREMEANPAIKLGIFLMQEFEVEPSDAKGYYNLTDILPNYFVNSFLQNKNPWQTMAPLWEKDFFNAIGGFDEELFYMEDPELHVRALLKDSTCIETFYHLPADCYYRINYHDDSKADFYENSIRYRILFFEKVCHLLLQKNLFIKYKKDIQNGLMKLFRSFMIYRINLYPDYYKAFIQLISKYNIFPLYKLSLIYLTVLTWRSTNNLVKVLKLRGLTYRMLS